MSDPSPAETWQRLTEGDVTDSPDRSVAEHVHRYLATGGADGFREGGMPNLILTTIGRVTGRLHRTAVFFGTDGDDYVLVASGSALSERQPNWFRNLREHPDVLVQVRDRRFLARARTTSGPERDRLWRHMTTQFPAYRTHYEARIRRQIPVVVLEPRWSPT
ncbi:nitroreductase/quinone reductase family protein [Microlunatus parietis]|uniref:Deazaflavin-dependent oxidoreductase (Nitroreductase family) n=1 Tax=Microlunatus parietis TaxID=682979 RepID=A0A7Y9IC04_9ACTN|nr:nitroreductase/quinone reductase family protein [Microlunatus parietis]NYE73897.1 deazaflavin-dependent oxidoreductase (nitroreductase family) [Microlunatus parietis]